MKFCGGAMQSPLVELPQTRLRILIISVIPISWKQKEVNIRSQLWCFPVIHVLTMLITRFYFLNFSNIILNISQYTAYGCSTSFPTLPLRDLLFIRRKVEFAFPRKCCRLSIYQHLIESINMNLQIFLDLIM